MVTHPADVKPDRTNECYNENRLPRYKVSRDHRSSACSRETLEQWQSDRRDRIVAGVVYELMAHMLEYQQVCDTRRIMALARDHWISKSLLQRCAPAVRRSFPDLSTYPNFTFTGPRSFGRRCSQISSLCFYPRFISGQCVRVDDRILRAASCVWNRMASFISVRSITFNYTSDVRTTNSMRPISDISRKM